MPRLPESERIRCCVRLLRTTAFTTCYCCGLALLVISKHALFLLVLQYFRRFCAKRDSS